MHCKSRQWEFDEGQSINYPVNQTWFRFPAFYICKVVSLSDMHMRKKDISSFASLCVHNGISYETLNLRGIVYETKQKTQTNSLECAVWPETHL